MRYRHMLKNVNNNGQTARIIILLSAALAAVLLFSVCYGKFRIPVHDILAVMFPKVFRLSDGQSFDMLHTVIMSVRMPRLISAVIIGAALAVSGAAYQGIFRNPMVSPDILGAAAGAGFGAAVGILLSMSYFWIQIMSFIFGMAAVAVTYAVSLKFGRNNNPALVLILTGIVIGTLFTSFISLTKYVADPDSKLPAITFWLMGSLATVTMDDIKLLLIPVILAGTPLMLLRWRLNVLSFGDEEARAMGVDTSRLRLVIIVCATLMTASSVSVCGMVGWVGLVIPHLSRMMVGPDNRAVLPVSMILGGLYLVVVDDIARNVFSMEVPLGVLTSIIGAPFFIYLLMYGKKGWN